MNKTINRLADILGKNPSFESEDQANLFFEECLQAGMFDKYFIMEYTSDFSIGSMTQTIESKEQGFNEDAGYTIYARIHEDYYTWINFFVCVSDNNKDFIVGDFSKTVVASSEKFFDKFMKNTKVTVWDMGDI